MFGFVSSLVGPSIVTPPKDIWNVTGAQVYLSCEVIGIPTPVLIWNKVSGTDFRKTSSTDRPPSPSGDGSNLKPWPLLFPAAPQGC